MLWFLYNFFHCFYPAQDWIHSYFCFNKPRWSGILWEKWQKSTASIQFPGQSNDVLVQTHILSSARLLLSYFSQFIPHIKAQSLWDPLLELPGLFWPLETFNSGIIFSYPSHIVLKATFHWCYLFFNKNVCPVSSEYYQYNSIYQVGAQRFY